jgi:hypothetical protein
MILGIAPRGRRAGVLVVGTLLPVLAVTMLGSCAIDRVGLRRPSGADAGASPGPDPGGQPSDAGQRFDEDAGGHGDGDPSLDAGSSASGDAGASLDGRVGGEDSGRLDAAPRGSNRDGGAPLCADDPDLVACYDLETSLLDGSMWENHLEGSGHDFAPGVQGAALALRAGATVSAPSEPSLTLTRMTLEMWVQPAAIPASGRVGLLDRDGQYGVFIYAGGQVSCSTAGERIFTSAVLEVDRWTHVACRFDGVELVAFIDGVAVNRIESSATIAEGGERLYLGANGPDGNERFSGRIDSIRIWNKARSNGEIATAAIP